MDITSLISAVSVLMLYLAIIPVGVGLYRWPYLNWSLRVFWLNILLGLFISIASEYLLSRRQNNLPVSYTNIGVDGLLMTVFFTAYMRNQVMKPVFIGICVALLLFMIGTIWWLGSSTSTYFLLSSIESSLVIMMAFVLLTERIRLGVGQSLRRQPVVYIAVSLLLVNTLTLVLNLFGSQLYTYSIPLFTLLVDTIAPVSNLIYYVFTCIAFWQSRFWVAPAGY